VQLATPFRDRFTSAERAALGQSEEHLRQLNRLADVGLLAAGMAHEIKNALVASKTYLDLLLEKNRDIELVDVVRREMNRIEALVGGVLRFSRPAKAEAEVLHLHGVLDHSLRLVQGQLESKGLELARAFRATADQVRGDEFQLEQAFLNLLVNAVQAMGPNGKLTVTTDLLAPDAKARAADAHQLRVDVQDTGEGIAPENLPHLFQPFFTTRPSGTGLGLAIAQRIIHEHRGAISVHSVPAQGTTFTVLLPATERA
jgi:signal transduction histidine kinase